MPFKGLNILRCGNVNLFKCKKVTPNLSFTAAISVAVAGRNG